MSAARQRRTRAETRHAILGAARRLLESDGAQNVRMEDVARAAGCSRRAIYLHFSSRTDLLLAVPEHIDQQEGLRGSMARIWDAPDAMSGLEAFTDHVTEYHPKIAATVRAVDVARRSDADAAAVWADRMEAWHALCERLAAWLEQDGVLAAHHSAGTAADVLWAMMSVRLWEDLVESRGWQPQRFRGVLYDLLAATLTTAWTPAADAAPAGDS